MDLEGKDTKGVSGNRLAWKGFIPRIISAALIAAGLIVAAGIFAQALVDRPLTGSFSGSLHTGSYPYPDLMGIDSLREYLGIYPTYEEAVPEDIVMVEDGQAAEIASVQPDDYDRRQEALNEELRGKILGGKWPGFPYVELDGRLYFSKQAVDDWFAEQGKKQLRAI